MRWGVRDEATDDHMTTELCMKEIDNCQRLSMGPNFVVKIDHKIHCDNSPLIIFFRSRFFLVKNTDIGLYPPIF